MGVDVEIKNLLSESEEAVLKILVEVLNEAIGEENAIQSVELCKTLNDFILWGGGFSERFTIQPARVRKLIHEICIRRLTIYPLLSGSNGYFISNNEKDIAKHIAGLTNRVNSIAERLRSVREWSCTACDISDI